MNVEELKKHANHVRQNAIRAVYSAQSGHPGGSLSSADILTYLYFEVMDINAENVGSIDRDRFVLSKGHITPGYYSVLAEKGFIPQEDITTFRKFGSKLQGHPNMNYIEAVDMSTGSLGQGVSTAVGMAMANKLDGNKHHIFTLLGDGECQEGEVWEAAMAASHYKLDNITFMVDCNHLQIDGEVEKVMNVYPLDKKFEGFGFEVVKANGHDFEAIKNAFDYALSVKRKPAVILWNTVKGKGVSFMEDQAGWHGKAPNEEQFKQAMKDLGGDE
ncbi:transketolase [Catenisphaera adipataccumulans]|uniref:Transketolase n=1 Tax=Catenisphaera adipataccumulans TaxID=700500 RepID=A0A7W8CXJ4_9FIRM|nr:transketolase [Catenisphaera adipataccumulans]MBB5183462.1 transketolase [Catenisphaera adipataccumulans]